MGGTDSSRTQTKVRACIWKASGVCGQEAARGGGKTRKVRMPSSGKRNLLSQPWLGQFGAQSSFGAWTEASPKKNLSWSRLDAPTEMSPKQVLRFDQVNFPSWLREREEWSKNLCFILKTKIIFQRRERKVLVYDPTVLNNRLSSSFALRYLSSDKIHNGYSSGHINTHTLILLKSTK